jgi:hypothetical protein
MRGTRTAFAEALDEQLWCQTHNHSWDDNPQPTRRPRFGYSEELRCTSCSTERHDTFNVVGDLIQRSYTYPPTWVKFGKDIHIANKRTELRKRRKRVHASEARKAANSNRRLRAV